MINSVQTDTLLCSPFGSVGSSLESHQTSLGKGEQPHPDLMVWTTVICCLALLTVLCLVPTAASGGAALKPVELPPSTAHSPPPTLGSVLDALADGLPLKRRERERGAGVSAGLEVAWGWGVNGRGSHSQGAAREGRHPDVRCRKQGGGSKQTRRIMEAASATEGLTPERI